jgi:hypothetical protein
MSGLRHALDFELPEKLEEQNRWLSDRNESLGRENVNLRMLVEKLKLEIARLGLELGKALNNGKEEKQK